MYRKRSFLFAVLGLFAVSAPAIERTEQHAWPVGDTPLVQLQTFRGAIRVETAKSSQVELELTARTSDESDRVWLNGLSLRADQFGSGLALRLERAGNGVELTLRQPPVRQVLLVLRVPAGAQLDLLTRDGGVDIGNDMASRVRVHTEQGDVYIGRVNGSVKVDTLRGNLSVARAAGDLDLRNRQGDILVGTVVGASRVKADSGNIEITNVEGALEAEAVAGNLEVGFIRGVQQPAKLKASAGDVHVKLDPAAAVDLQARSHWGRIKSDAAFDDAATKSGKRRLTAQLNGGGPLLMLDASGGDVRIEAAPSYL